MPQSQDTYGTCMGAERFVREGQSFNGVAVVVFCCCFLLLFFGDICLFDFFCFVFVLMSGRDRIKIPLTRAIIESSFLLIGLLDKYHKCNGNGLVIIYILPYL